MKTKSELITALRDEYDRWEAYLAGCPENRLARPLEGSPWSTQDVVAHLHAWQQVSIARLKAALYDHDPIYPAWLAGLPPESDEHREVYNQRIYQQFHGQPWLAVHMYWRDGFLRFLKLAEAVPEIDLLETGRYAWLNDYPLAAVLIGSANHHAEHFESFAE